MTWYSVYLATRNPDGGDAQADLAGLDKLLDAMTNHAGVVSGGQAGWAARISVQAASPRNAVARGGDLIAAAARSADLPDWPVVRLEAVDHDELDRELARPQLPDMVSGPEAADMLGVTRQRLHQLRSNPRFPQPLIERTGALLYARATIESFRAAWDRRPGRPHLTVVSGDQGSARDTVGTAIRRTTDRDAAVQKSPAKRPVKVTARKAAGKSSAPKVVARPVKSGSRSGKVE